MIVPFTIEHTNLKAAQKRDAVNIECDMVGKYVARAVDSPGSPSENRKCQSLKPKAQSR